jgi:hypothetical protein
MSEASERRDTPDRTPEGVPASGEGADPADVPETGEGGSRHGGWASRLRSRLHGGGDQEEPLTGVAASMVTSGGLLLAMVEDLRMRGGTQPEDVRPLADTFARHCAAKEVTVRKALERHGESVRVVQRDRQEGDLIQGILDRGLTGRHPEDTRTLTIDGGLTQMYQYLLHERRDLVPALRRAVQQDESADLAEAFEAANRAA